MNTLSGAINRRIFILGYALLLLAAFIIAAIIRTNPDSLYILGWLFGVLIALPAAFYLLIARFHDIGMSGGWSVLIFIPGINFLMIIALALWPGSSS